MTMYQQLQDRTDDDYDKMNDHAHTFGSYPPHTVTSSVVDHYLLRLSIVCWVGKSILEFTTGHATEANNFHCKILLH